MTPDPSSPAKARAADPCTPEFPDLDLMALLPPELRQPASLPSQPRRDATTVPAPPGPEGDPTAAWAAEATSFAFAPRNPEPADAAPRARSSLPESLRHLDSPAAAAEGPRAPLPDAALPNSAPSGPAATGFAAFLADGLRHLDAPSPREPSPPAPAAELAPRPAADPAPSPPAPRPTTRPSPPSGWTLPPSPSLAGAREIAGLVAACLVDGEEGLLLAAEGRGLDLEAAAAHGTEVVRAERRAIELLGLQDDIDDILVTTGRRLYVMRPLRGLPTVFLYLILDRKAANLGMARIQLDRIESGLGP